MLKDIDKKLLEPLNSICDIREIKLKLLIRGIADKI